MNKYQEFFTKQLEFCLFDNIENYGGRKQVEIVDDSLVVKQFDDITITKYLLVIASRDCTYDAFDIEVKESTKWEKAKLAQYKKNGESAYKIELDFNKQIKAIKITSKDGMFDDIELNVKFVEADKEAYYARKAEEKAKADAEAQKEINDKIQPITKKGQDLVNIYWNLVNDKVKSVEICLYLNHETGLRLIGKYKENSEITFKSITGLAYGSYLYEIRELDEKGNEIANSGKIEFALQNHVAHSGKNEVYFGR